MRGAHISYQAIFTFLRDAQRGAVCSADGCIGQDSHWTSTRLRGRRSTAADSRPLLPATRLVVSQNSNRGEDWLSMVVLGVTDHTTLSSSASAAVNVWTSAEADPCIASATITIAVVVSRTAE